MKKHKIQFALMHTTNLYPTPTHLIRLNALKEMKNAFPNIPLGLSDHTNDNFTSFAALGLGASIIEKHYIDKKSRIGVDVPASIDFSQLKELIKGSKEIYKSLPGKKKPVKEELDTMKFAFASVVSIRKIKKGEKLSLKNIWVKRPGTGDFLAKDLKKLIGKTAKVEIKYNNQIKKNYIK